MNRLSRLALVLLLPFAGCSTWHYRSTDDHATTYGRSGRTLSIATGPERVQFTVPPAWKIISPLDEPLDWDYVADSPSGQLSLGVRLEPQAQTLTIPARQQAYLANVHHLYDPKVRLEKAASVTLGDGRSVPAYRYSSKYWGERFVIIIPAGTYAATFEFSNPDGKSIRQDWAEIQQILGTYSVQKK